MQINDIDVYAEVYHFDEDKKICYVKVEFGGMYISGIQVKPSLKTPELGYWVQMPSYKSGNLWKRYVEFKKQSPLHPIIEKKCQQVAGVYLGTAEMQDYLSSADAL